MFILSLISVTSVWADDSDYPDYKFYVGGGLGYGNTGWTELVDYNNDPLTDLSAPTSAQTGGLSYEGFIGYNVAENFAIEARYTQYPQATLGFAHLNLGELIDELIHENLPIPYIPVPNFYGVYRLPTNLGAYGLVGKFFIPAFPKYHIKAFMTLGADYTVRQDQLGTVTSLSPTFGMGMDWRFSRRFKATAEFEYVTGNGASTANPVVQYVPFLYNFDIRLSYLFG